MAQIACYNMGTCILYAVYVSAPAVLHMQVTHCDLEPTLQNRGWWGLDLEPTLQNPG